MVTKIIEEIFKGPFHQLSCVTQTNQEDAIYTLSSRTGRRINSKLNYSKELAPVPLTQTLICVSLQLVLSLNTADTTIRSTGKDKPHAETFLQLHYLEMR
jgi:hypothetical protein